MEELMGKLVDVEIIEATKFSMMGQILEEEDEISVKSPASIQVKTPVVETSFQGSLFSDLRVSLRKARDVPRADPSKLHCDVYVSSSSCGPLSHEKRFSTSSLRFEMGAKRQGV